MRFLYLVLSVGCFGSGYAAGAIIGHEQSDRHLVAPPVIESPPEVEGCPRRVSFFAGGVRVDVERDGALFITDPGDGRRWLMLPVDEAVRP